MTETEDIIHLVLDEKIDLGYLKMFIMWFYSKPMVWCAICDGIIIWTIIYFL